MGSFHSFDSMTPMAELTADPSRLFVEITEHIATKDTESTLVLSGIVGAVLAKGRRHEQYWVSDEGDVMVRHLADDQGLFTRVEYSFSTPVVESLPRAVQEQLATRVA
jgi:hypothetical protein